MIRLPGVIPHGVARFGCDGLWNQRGYSATTPPTSRENRLSCLSEH